MGAEAQKPKGKPFRMRMRLSRKLLIGFILLSVALSVSLCGYGYVSFRNYFFQSYNEKALSAAYISADLLDGDRVGGYVEAMLAGDTPDVSRDESYQEAMRELGYVKERTGMRFIYIFYPLHGEREGYLYLFDAMNFSETPEDVCAFGSLDPYPGTTVKIDHTFATGEVYEEMIVTRTESQGYVGTVFVPLRDSKQNIVALVGVDVEMREVDSQLMRYLLTSAGATALVVFIVVFLLLTYVRRKVARPLGRLTDSVVAYTDGEELVYHQPDVHTGDEIEKLSGSFAQMAENIETYMGNLARATADKQRIATELDMATHIQMSMLPSIFPPFPDCKDYDIFARVNPAKEVGGDFYDFFRLDDHRLCFLIADVSGKGVPAALFMMIAKTLVKNQAQSGCTLMESFTKANNQLCENNETSMFVTALMMMLDTERHVLTVCNAGHNPPLIRRKDGAFEYLKLRPGCPLATMEGVRYREMEIPFGAGDEMYLYTDGVTEALNPREELYSEARLLEKLNLVERAGERPVSEIIDAIFDDIHLYADGAPQADDITMLMVRSNI